MRPVAFEEERRQIEKVRKLRKERDNSLVERGLKKVKEAAADGVNLVEPILEAVRAYATIGEISGVLCEQWGRYEQLGI